MQSTTDAKTCTTPLLSAHGRQSIKLPALFVRMKCISALTSNVANEFVKAAIESKGQASASLSCDCAGAAFSALTTKGRGSTSVPNRLKPKLLVEIKRIPSLEATGARVLVKLSLSKKYDVCLHEECSDTASFCSTVFTTGDTSIGKLLSLRVSDAGAMHIFAEALISHKSGESF